MQTPISFANIPSDIQLNIISFLQPIDISSFALTCRHFSSLCSPSSPSLWLALCDRRWGTKTHLPKWSAAASHRLYKTLHGLETLIGFWRLISSGIPGSPSLVLFEWCSACVTGFRISPSPDGGDWAVRKVPFLWLGVSEGGEVLSYLCPDVVPVTVSFMGCNHFVVEEKQNFCVDPLMDDSAGLLSLDASSPPDRVMSEIYQYFANRAITGAERLSRRWRKKKEKERLGRKRWEADHFVKISNHFPTPTRPLQGLWKGITEDMRLVFYLVTHDDVGGITCRRVGDSAEHFLGYSPVFWISNTTFLEPPFSKEEHDIYSMRDHIGCVGSVHCNMDNKIVSRILCINCTYDLVLPDLAGSSSDPRNVEGRIWEYDDGTFGFGFLRNNFIVDLKHIAVDGYNLSDVESSHQTYVL